jgi:phosphoribosyl-ATP pyrophosphohydrolase
MQPKFSKLVTNLVAHMFSQVADFHDKVTALPIPIRPSVLDSDDLEWSVNAMKEELEEFEQATLEDNIDGAADAMIDLIYFALGRLVQMGVPAKEVFEAVHEANMQKQQGELSKRPGSKGHDAVKPEGWQAPDHTWLLEFNPLNYTTMAEMADFWQNLSPALKRVAKLRETKGHDYNNVLGGRDAYFPFGHMSYAHMVITKSLRIQSLVNCMLAGQSPNHESLLDSVLDLINYSDFYACAMQADKLENITAKAGASSNA